MHDVDVLRHRRHALIGLEGREHSRLLVGGRAQFGKAERRDVRAPLAEVEPQHLRGAELGSDLLNEPDQAVDGARLGRRVGLGIVDEGRQPKPRIGVRELPELPLGRLGGGNLVRG